MKEVLCLNDKFLFFYLRIVLMINYKHINMTVKLINKFSKYFILLFLLGLLLFYLFC